MATRRLRLVLLIVVGVLGFVPVLVLLLVLLLSRPVPQGTPGAAADELAHAVERAVHKDAWDRTGAVRWTFPGGHQHLWDRQRGLARVRWGGTEVLLDLGSKQGQAFEHGAAVTGEKQDKLVKRAYAYWINDSFWLNPVAKLFDPGTQRYLVPQPGGPPALLLRYTGGGLTPGDSYLWLPGPNDVPRAWRMWVSIIPIGGLEVSWEGWTPLSTGALVSTVHRGLGIPLRLGDVAGAADLRALEPGPDPFAVLGR